MYWIAIQQMHRLQRNECNDCYCICPNYIPPEMPQCAPMDLHEIDFIELVHFTVANYESDKMKRLMPEETFELTHMCVFYESQVFQLREDDVFQTKIIYKYIPADDKIIKLLDDYVITPFSLKNGTQ